MIIDKQPNERIPCIWNASRELPDGDSLLTGDVKVYDEQLTDVTIAMLHGTPTVSNGRVSAAIKAGESGKKYNVRFLYNTTLGFILEADITINVFEKRFE